MKRILHVVYSTIKLLYSIVNMNVAWIELLQSEKFPNLKKNINKLNCKVLSFTNIHIHITLQALVYIIANSRI